MDKMNAVRNIIKDNGGIAKTADFVVDGLSNYDVANLCKEGCIVRVRHGYYQLAGQEDINEEQVLAEALRKTFANREHHFTVEQFEQVMSFGDDSVMQKNMESIYPQDQYQDGRLRHCPENNKGFS